MDELKRIELFSDSECTYILLHCCNVESRSVWDTKRNSKGTFTQSQLWRPQVAATCGWKIMFDHCKDTNGLINDRVQPKIKCIFLYLLILWLPLVSIVCIHTYIIMYNRWFLHKKSLSHWQDSAMESQWLATKVVTACLWCVDTLIYAHIKSVSPLLVAATSSSTWTYLDYSLLASVPNAPCAPYASTL